MIIDTITSEVMRLRDDEEHTWEEIAEQLDLPGEWTARRKYKAGVLLKEASYLSEENEVEEPSLEKQEPILDLVIKDRLPTGDKGMLKRFEPLQRYGDCMVTSDYHVPLHDPGLINKMINTADENGIKQLIIAGDLFHMEAFSSFLPQQPEASWPIERKEANRVVKTLLNHFEEIDITWGNHDFRLVKAVGYKHSFEACLQWALSELTDDEWKRVRISDLDYMEYFPLTSSSGRKYRVCHPRSFSSVPLTVPKKLQPKYSCSVMTAHSHHLAMGFAANGYDHIIELGGFYDKQKTEYIQKTTSNHEWVQGYVMFKDGVPSLHSPALGNI